MSGRTWGPTPPIEFGGPAGARGGAGEVTARLATPPVPVSEAVIERRGSVCAAVTVDPAARAEAGRDWWPVALSWALAGSAPAIPAVIARPSSAAEVAAVLAVCNEARVPVTAAAGRSGVCGASVPAFGGVVLDMCGLAGVERIDGPSLLVDVLPGTFGVPLEEELRASGLTLGHWPQSIELSTVGGWLACRSAGQYSTRYGKIEDMVAGVEVALADGRIVRFGGAAPRAAVGPDLTQLFVGSEGTLGVITGARLRVRPAPDTERRAAYGFESFEDGLDACRRILRRGATPAVLRLYDGAESARSFGTEGTHVLIVLDEGEAVMVDASMAIVDEECGGSASSLDEGLVARWLEHRNDVSSLASLYRHGIVVDTCEVAASWSRLPGLYQAGIAALSSVPGTMAATAHQSHAYPDGACLYFTFAGRPAKGTEPDPHWNDRYYTAAWDAVTDAVLEAGGALSHHHGIGLNRSRFMARALGPGLDVLAAIKTTLDPNGILNPGKLGLPSPFGQVAWPPA